jgi:hypothetical protein
MAGCPKCGGIDFVRANPHKESVVYPNGFTTFREIRVGEKLILPEKWFSKEFDELPPAYFSSLPHPDGVTPSKLGLAAAGILGDYSTLDAASSSVNSLLRDLSGATGAVALSEIVNNAAALIDKSVSEVTSANQTAAGYAQDARASTYWARKRGAEMAAATDAGDQAAADQARAEIQNVLSTAVGSARLALQSFYATPTSTPSAFPADVTAAAQAASAAIASDTNYCSSVAQSHSAVNSAVHAFKTTWNASQTPKVPTGTGNYEQATADALKRVLGNAPAACATRAEPSPSPSSRDSGGGLVTPPQEQGLSVGAILGIGLLGAGAVGGAIYLATRGKKPPARVRRVRPRLRREQNPMIRPRYDTIARRKP